MSCPTGRPIASSTKNENGWTGAASAPIRAANDSPTATSSRCSATRLTQIVGDLADQDRSVLLWLSEVRLASGSQLARRLWAADAPTDTRARAARRTLARLERLRLIDRLGHRVGGVRGGSASIIYGLGPVGRRVLARTGFTGKRLGTPGDRHVAHTLAITELGVGLHEAGLRGELDLIEIQTEPHCWRSFLGLMGAPQTLKPDLFVRIGVGAYEDRWFIEMDLATEAGGTLRGKVRQYLSHYRGGGEQSQHGVYPRVLWAVPDHRRSEQITDVLLELPESVRRLFVVWARDEVIGRLSAEARS
jgi:Replication-relaxation